MNILKATYFWGKKNGLNIPCFLSHDMLIKSRFTEFSSFKTVLWHPRWLLFDPFSLQWAKNPSVIDWNILLDFKINSEERLISSAFRCMFELLCWCRFTWQSAERKKQALMGNSSSDHEISAWVIKTLERCHHRSGGCGGKTHNHLRLWWLKFDRANAIIQIPFAASLC